MLTVLRCISPIHNIAICLPLPHLDGTIHHCIICPVMGYAIAPTTSLPLPMNGFITAMAGNDVNPTHSMSLGDEGFIRGLAGYMLRVRVNIMIMGCEVSFNKLILELQQFSNLIVLKYRVMTPTLFHSL